MCFIEHYNQDVTDLIDESRTGKCMEVDAYGYENDDINIRYWSENMLFEDMSCQTIVSINPLYLDVSNYDIGDVYFESNCVGYAIENDYDSVVMQTEDGEFYITYDLDGMGFIFEAVGDAKPLAGKKISKEKRAEIMAKRKEKKKKRKSPTSGIKVDVLLSNTGRLSPDRVERAMKEVRTRAPEIKGTTEINGAPYIRAEYNFKSVPSKEMRRQMGYADVSSDKKYVAQVYCTCKDFFYRLYAPYVAAGLATWNIPPKYKSNQKKNISPAGHNKQWTKETNPDGKLFLCKHLWAFLSSYVAGKGAKALSDQEIDDVIDKYFDDIDGDGTEEPVDTEFKQAFGKLYQRQAGKKTTDIKDKPLEGKKISKDKRSAFKKKADDIVDTDIDTDTEEETEEDEE